MHANERKTRLFENIVRLRRAERAAPDSRDVVVVRANLEQELGEAVSQRLAARLLGVSHTALARWINAGDVPLVHDAEGREQVPVSAVLDLHEAIGRERNTGRRSRHLLEPAMIASRDRARQIDAGKLVPEGNGKPLGHDRASLRSLAYHRVLARRLRRPMVDDALHLIWTWREQDKIDPRYADRWEYVLHKPVAEIRRIIGEDTPDGRDLRQNSPFAGALSEAERQKILREVG
jgi:hypothetical protein